MFEEERYPPFAATSALRASTDPVTSFTSKVTNAVRMILVSIPEEVPEVGTAVGMGTAPPADSDIRTALSEEETYTACGEADDLSSAPDETVGETPVHPAAAITAMHTSMSAITL
jgi:hypothetical protein